MEYYTHSNGDRPFKVKIDGNNLKIFFEML